MPKRRKLTVDDRRFIDDIAVLLVPWGMSSVTARIYGYLLLSANAVTLDQIAEDLQVSKSSVSVSARALERASLARRSGERGSKRIYYEASESCGNAIGERIVMLGAMARLLQTRAATMTSTTAKQRLEKVASLYTMMRDAVTETVQRVIDSAENPVEKSPSAKRPAGKSPVPKKPAAKKK